MRQASLIMAPILICLSFMLPHTAYGQRLVIALTARTIAVDSSFSGEALTLFGTIEPEFQGAPIELTSDYDVIIVVQGPAVDRVVREKTSNFGIWLNTKQVEFKKLPSFFWGASTSALEAIADKPVLEEYGLLPDSQPGLVLTDGNGHAEELGQQLVRLMRKENLYGVREHGAIFRSNTLFSASLELPSNVPNGNFLAKVYLFRNGEVVATRAQGFSIRKTGVERLAGTTAQTMPLVYGLACVVIAVFLGWLSGVLFRR